MFHRFFFSIRWLGVIPAFVLLAISTTSLLAQSGVERFYYYQGARIPLNVNPRLVAVRFDPTLSTNAQRNLVESAGDVENFDESVQVPAGGLVWMPLRAGRNPLTAAARLNGQTGVQFASPVYDVGSMQFAETDEFLARFKADMSADEIAAFNASHGATVATPLAHSDRVLVLKPTTRNAQTARELANAYVEAGVVDFAEPNFVLRETQPRDVAPLQVQLTPLVPNDSSFGLEWGMQNTRQFQGAVAGADINATNAWGVTQGASSIKIAVIDEGVDGTHSELIGKVLSGYNALTGTSNTTPKSGDYHGTAVAGVAAANSNNSAGIAGVCWFCQILPVKVAERDAQGNWTTTTAALAAGIDWAWQNGADVLNNSWTMASPSDTVQLAIINARFSGRGGKGSTVIFSTGNSNASSVAYPASLNTYVIAVGASNWCDQRKTPTNNQCNNNNASWGSNYGSALDLVAPGEAIYTTCNVGQCSGSSYIYLSGTSLAAPFISGTVGLLYSLNPNLTPDKVQQVLQNGAKDTGAVGKDNETGYGRLDAYQAIAQLYNLNLSVSDSRTLVQPGDTLAYTISYANTGTTAMGTTAINVTVPTNTTYVSSTPAFSPQGGGIYKLNLGTLAGNTTGTATFRVQAQPSAAGQKIIFNASIGGAFPEANTSDNAASDTTFGIRTQHFVPFIFYGNAP
ncbi:MAG: S8 family serine peptidase [Chloroflexi bacterium]|nr:S8 family serine peptidase [Chloroflexota bacterium]